MATVLTIGIISSIIVFIMAMNDHKEGGNRIQGKTELKFVMLIAIAIPI